MIELLQENLDFVQVAAEELEFSEPNFIVSFVAFRLYWVMSINAGVLVLWQEIVGANTHPKPRSICLFGTEYGF